MSLHCFLFPTIVLTFGVAGADGVAVSDYGERQSLRRVLHAQHEVPVLVPSQQPAQHTVRVVPVGHCQGVLDSEVTILGVACPDAHTGPRIISVVPEEQSCSFFVKTRRYTTCHTTPGWETPLWQPWSRLNCRHNPHRLAPVSLVIPVQARTVAIPCLRAFVQAKLQTASRFEPGRRIQSSTGWLPVCMF